jgi:hypothetical protein
MDILTVVVILALVAVIATLAWGVGSMAHGGSYDREHSEQIMFTRVGIQALAFALVLLALIFSFA